MARLWGVLNGFETACLMAHHPLIMGPYTFSFIFIRIQNRLNKNWEASFRRLLGEANKCAEWMANESLLKEHGFCMIDRPPKDLLWLRYSDIGAVHTDMFPCVLFLI